MLRLFTFGSNRRRIISHAHRDERWIIRLSVLRYPMPRYRYTTREKLMQLVPSTSIKLLIDLSHSARSYQAGLVALGMCSSFKLQ